MLELWQKQEQTLLNRLASSNWGNIQVTTNEGNWDPEVLQDPDNEPAENDVIFEDPLDLMDDWAKLDLPNPNPPRDPMPEL